MAARLDLKGAIGRVRQHPNGEPRCLSCGANSLEHLNWCPESSSRNRDTASLLEDILSFLRRFIVADEAALVVGAVWVAHTHVFEAADATPRLSIRSAEASSGKTRWLEVLKLLVRGQVHMVGVSDAAMFRLIEEGGRTLLLDEIDSIFGPKARDREELRGMLNAGYERGATVPRCVGEGSRLKVQEFNVFAPVAFAGLGKLPYTLETRSIVIRMKPRTAGEPVERLRRRQVKPESDALRERLEVWAEANISKLTYAEPALPDELTDRAQDVSEPLLAIVDLAGGDWPERVRSALVELFQDRDEDEQSIGRRLLADIRAVFNDPEADLPFDETHGQAITSGGLAADLAKIEGGPWAEWGRDDKPISANKVARMLQRFGIRPDQHWVVGRKIRGYLRDDFEDAWARHLPNPDDDAPPGESGRGDKVVGANDNKAKGPTTLNALPLCPGEGTEVSPNGRSGDTRHTTRDVGNSDTQMSDVGSGSEPVGVDFEAVIAAWPSMSADLPASARAAVQDVQPVTIDGDVLTFRVPANRLEATNAKVRCEADTIRDALARHLGGRPLRFNLVAHDSSRERGVDPEKLLEAQLGAHHHRSDTPTRPQRPGSRPARRSLTNRGRSEDRRPR